MGDAISETGVGVTGQAALTPEAHQYLERLWASMPPDRYRRSSGMVYGEQAKYLSWDFEALRTNTLELLQITDVQFGHIACRYERVIEFRDWVLKSPSRFMLWTGDMIDAWAMHSPGIPWDQTSSPRQQLLRFCEVWGPARHRIIGYVGGNHERRGHPSFGDHGMMIAILLRIPYSDGRQMIDIHFGGHAPFKVTLWHGAGGARTRGAAAQTLDRFMQQGDSQLYLMGHLHQGLIMPAWKEIREPGKRRVRLQKTFGAIGTSFLETWGTYGEMKGYAPHDVLMPRAVLHRDGTFEVTLK